MTLRALFQVGGSLCGNDLIHRGQDPDAEALEQVGFLSIKSMAHTPYRERRTQSNTHTVS